MKSIFLVIVLVATVDCRSHFKPHSKPIEKPKPEWLDSPGGLQTSHRSAKKVAMHPPAIILDDDDDDLKDNEDTLGFENTNPGRVAAGEFYQSDMLLTEDQWDSLRERKAIRWEERRWTEGPDGYPLVPYIFYDSVNQNVVRDGMDHWMEHTCIIFEETSNPGQPHLRFIDGDGCFSFVGMWSGNGQRISPCNDFNTVVHEIGHAIGFYHEQCRSDRDAYVTIIEDNVNKTKSYNFDKEIDNNYSVPYDYTSVMHYGTTLFSINSKPTIVSNDPLDMDLIGRGVGLSHRDKLLSNRMYNCIGKWLVECGLSLDPCLNDGYTGKDCLCVCPPGTSGTNCEEKTGSYYGTPGCGGNFSLSSGTIRHPMAGGNYGDNERCIWFINAAGPIKITFNSFDIENIHDHLYIRDGKNFESPVSGNFTGQYVPPPVQISNNMAYILFKSDLSRTRTGFELQWEPSGIELPTTQPSITENSTTLFPTTDVTVPPTTKPATLPPVCGGEYSLSGGTIRHPSGVGNYHNNELCFWIIRAANPIHISFISFSTEAGADFLYVNDGDNIGSPMLGVFEGSIIPSPVNAFSNTAYLFFKSDYSINSTGFEIQWEPLVHSTTAAPAISSQVCGGECSFSSGTIRHPSGYGDYKNNENCLWIIRAANPIEITFISFSTEFRWDFLYVRDGDSIESQELGNFTGFSHPSPVQANSNAVYLLFKSDNSNTASGFEIKWEPLDH